MSCDHSVPSIVCHIVFTISEEEYAKSLTNISLCSLPFAGPPEVLRRRSEDLILVLMIEELSSLDIYDLFDLAM